MRDDMNFKNVLISIYLNESLEDVKKSYPEEDHDLIDYIHKNILPDSNKSDRLLHHAIKVIKNDENEYGNTIHRNSSGIRVLFSNDYKNAYNMVGKYNLQNRLGDVKTGQDLISLTIPYKQKHDDEIARKTSKTIYEDDNCIVKRHNTWESSKLAARLHPNNPTYNDLNEKGKAAWCVSSDSTKGKEYFEKTYTDNNKHPMYTLEDKNTKRKYAFIANPNNRLNKIEIRDEHDRMESRGLIKDRYPQILKQNNEFSDFARHIDVNHRMNRKMEDNKKITDDDFKEFLQHNLSSIDSEGTVLHDIHRYSELEHGNTVKEFYKNHLLNTPLNYDSDDLHRSILEHIPMDRDTLGKYFEKNYKGRLDASQSEQFAVKHKNIDPKYARQVIKAPEHSYSMLSAALQHPDISKEELLNAYKNTSSMSVRSSILDSPKIDHQIITQIMAHHLANKDDLDYDTANFTGLRKALMHPELNAGDLNNIHSKLFNNNLKETMIYSPNADSNLHHLLRTSLMGKFIHGHVDNSNLLFSYRKSPPTQEQFDKEISVLPKGYVDKLFGDTKSLPDSVKTMYKQYQDKQNEF